MTPTLVMQIVLLGLLTVVVAYLVPMLVQLRRTARAVEDLVRDAGPRIVGATTSLESVLERTDRVLEGLESGTRGISGAVSGFSSLFGALRSAGKGLSKGPATLAGLLGILAAAWQAAASSRRAARAAAAQESAAAKPPSGQPDPAPGDPGR